MSRAGHGGGVDRVALELGLSRGQILDFSASINPRGLPEPVREAVTLAIERIVDYPEIDAHSLCQALSLHHHLPAENLLAGSGSTELIYLLPRVLRPRRALIIEPAFSEYEPALRQAGCLIDSFTLKAEDNFRFELLPLLDALHPDTEMVWLANPGNPSGVAIAPELLCELVEGLEGRRLVIDEAFVDFSPQHSLIDAVTEYENLFVLRSLTKFYAIPGLRVGYLVGPAADVALLATERQPWTLSNLALAAAKACLEDTGYRQLTLEEVPLLREQLKAELQQLSLSVFSSVANYLLFRTPDHWPTAEALCDGLQSQGILLRNCADFTSLDHRYLRVAVRSEAENRQLLRALKNIAEEYRDG